MERLNLNQQAIKDIYQALAKVDNMPTRLPTNLSLNYVNQYEPTSEDLNCFSRFIRGRQGSVRGKGLLPILVGEKMVPLQALEQSFLADINTNTKDPLDSATIPFDHGAIIKQLEKLRFSALGKKASALAHQESIQFISEQTEKTNTFSSITIYLPQKTVIYYLYFNGIIAETTVSLNPPLKKDELVTTETSMYTHPTNNRIYFAAKSNNLPQTTSTILEITSNLVL